jgi:hypothetical protein
LASLLQHGRFEDIETEATMRTSQTHPSGALSGAAERQMRNWAFDLQTRQKLAEEREKMQLKDLI